MKMTAGEGNGVPAGAGGVMSGVFSLLLMIGFSSGRKPGGPRPGATQRLRGMAGPAADDAIVILPGPSDR
jgi:hypothetical protein